MDRWVIIPKVGNVPEFAVSLKIVGLSGVKTRESNPTARARLLGSATHLIPAASQIINYSAATGVRAIFFAGANPLV